MTIKFLIIRLSSIGDIVLTTPVIRCLKQQVEDAEIHFVIKEKHFSVLKANPWITKIHTLDGKLSDLIGRLEEEQFDYIIDLHQNFRSNRIKGRLKIPAFSFNKLNLQKWLIVNFKINRLPDQHIVERYLKTVTVFDVVNDNKGLDYFIPEDEEFDFSNLPPHFNDGYIAWVIAGTYFTKKLPSEKIIEVCRKIDKPVILLGGRNEKAEGGRMAALFPEKVVDLCGETTLNESADIVRKSRLVLTNDTGLMHIAAAFRKKILSFWGNTIPEMGMSPYMPDKGSQILEVKGLKCRPCSKLGYDNCPKKHFKCMMNLDINEVVQWIENNF